MIKEGEKRMIGGERRMIKDHGIKRMITEETERKA